MAYVPYTRQAVIGWRNVFADGALSASSETPAGPYENAVDGLTWDYWEGAGDVGGDLLVVALAAPAAVDYLAIAAHNLGTSGASIQLQKSVDGVTWTSVAGPFSPTDNKPWLWRFASATSSRYRIKILGGPVRLGVVQAGVQMLLPEGIFVGHRPASLNRKPSLMPNKSEGGQLLGRSVIRKGATNEIGQERVSQAWVRETWEPFAKHAETGSFFFAWRHDTFPQEVIFAWATAPDEVEQGQNGFMKVTLSIEGQVE